MNFPINCLILLIICTSSYAANILVVCPFFGKSHSAFIHPIVLALAEKGHNITAITTNVIKDAPPNLRQIKPDVEDEEFEMDASQLFKWNSLPAYLIVTVFFELTFRKGRDYLESSAVQSFLAEDNRFDVVLVEAFLHDCYYGFAHRYQAPLVMLGTGTFMHAIAEPMGNPSVVSYLSYEFYRDAGDLDILQRTNNYLLYKYTSLVYKWVYKRRHEWLIRRHFGDDAPSVGALERNISVALFNTHYSIDEVKPLIPGIVEVGGVHLKPPKKLPEELQRFLDGAEHGFIFFSLGSNLKSANLPKEKMEAILKVFSKLKQRVLWKFESVPPAGLSPNVMISKWLPQTDLLAHPKIKIFITHCGMLSTQEAVHRGVPVIAIPVYGDQLLNAAKLTQTGMGVRLAFDELDERRLGEAIAEILDDPKYAAMARQVSMRFNDRPNRPLETAVYWVEYVIRHGGADFMRSKLAETSWIQYHLIDVYVAAFLIVNIIVYLVSQALKMMFGLCGVVRKMRRPVGKSDRNDKKKK